MDESSAVLERLGWKALSLVFMFLALVAALTMGDIARELRGIRDELKTLNTKDGK